jgi:hypothetical protein
MTTLDIFSFKKHALFELPLLVASIEVSMRPIDATNHGAHQARVPTALQTVFLTSNRGIDVHVAPPKRLVNPTILRRGWLGRKRALTFDGPKGGAPASNRTSLVLTSSKDRTLMKIENVGVPSKVRTIVRSIARSNRTPCPISL